MPATLADAVQDILDDLDRGTSASARVKSGIVAAIDYYRSSRFGFNTTATYTVALPAFEQDWPASCLEIDHIQHWNAQGRQPIDEENLAVLAAAQSSATPLTGVPRRFATEHRRIRFDPQPDTTYTVRVSMLVDLPEISSNAAAGAYNAWIDEAWQLIKTRAMVRYLVYYGQGEEAAAQAQRIATDEQLIYQQLRRSAGNQQTSGRIAPSI